ncbi:MAG: 4a-hydroxytetrahydrobiopterin dehydratase [Thermoplasmatota archaeon]
MAELVSRHCVPCEGGTPSLASDEARDLVAQVPGWSLCEGEDRIPRLQRCWRLADFTAALDLTNRIGALAEAEGHHPDLHLTGYRNLRVALWTHAAGGLTENDFILAAKIDQLAAATR